MIIWRRIGFGVVGALALIGCSEDGALLAPRWGDTTDETATVLAALECRVEPRAGSMTCIRVEPGPADGLAAAVLGGQGTYISLESSNVTYEDEIFSADVTVRNLLTQSLGTVDGAQVDEEGVRIFFIDDPASIPAAAGPVTLQNADGTAVFTRPDQPFFRYPQALGPGRTSLPKNWRWSVPDGVQSFTFGVYVAAAVEEEGELIGEVRIDGNTISSGREHTCALTPAGYAYCWGSAVYGQVGHGSHGANMNILQPVAVKGPEGGASIRFGAISAGGEHTCALTVDGRAYCWGRSYYGQLGFDDSSPRSTPVAVSDPVGETLEFTSVTAGDIHTCALAVTGVAYCWGRGSNGQLGNNQTGNSSRPVAVAHPEGVRFTSIEVGDSHACGLTAEGSAYCWGDAEFGQLGNGTMGVGARHGVPVRVADPDGGPIRFTSISAGSGHTCGSTTSGKAYCWGHDGYGQLGNGGTLLDSHQAAPVPVVNPAGGPDLIFAFSPLRRLPLLAYLGERAGHDRYPRG